MDFDSRQTRRFLIAGTAPFPAPFPGTGTISIENGSLQLSPEGPRQYTTFVILQDRPGQDHATLRVVRAEDAAAIFIPGKWEYLPDQTRVFRFARNNRADDLEQGEWFLKSDINAETMSARLNVDVTRRDSNVKGIVFVPEHLPVMSITEASQVAGAAELAGVARISGGAFASYRCGCDDCC